MSTPGTRRGRDRGLHAVARVREVRERDSRLGLQQARREQEARERRLAQLEDAVREHGSFVSGDMRQFVALRASLAALRQVTTQARAELDAAVLVATSAQAHWQGHHTQLSAVESLLERRADDRRVEAGKADAHELDDVAGRLWLRRHRAEADS